MQEQKNNLYIPGAIILAGFLIAGGIYMTNNKGGVANVDNGGDGAKKTEITIKPVGKDDNVLGSVSAPITIVEFSDTECPFCKRFHTTMHSIVDTYGKDGKVAWVYRHFPLDSLHQKTRKEAEAVECAGDLGGGEAYWKVLDSIYTNTTSNDGLDVKRLPEFAKTAGLDVTKFNECLSSGKMAGVVEAEYQDGLKSGVHGTPYSVMMLSKALKSSAEKEINDFVQSKGLQQNVTVLDKKIVLNGALPVEIIKPIIDIVLK
ncbi:MAG: DsbA family protein [Candidatus Paceibacterota bacterium]|jgi:protein-disulfide isomerase